MRLLVALEPDFDEPPHLGLPMIQHPLGVPRLLEHPPVHLFVRLPYGANPDDHVDQPEDNRGHYGREHGDHHAHREFASAQVTRQEVDHVGCDQRKHTHY